MSVEEGMSYGELGELAATGASDYLWRAINAVEQRMGKGAAEKYPQIVAALVQASATEYLASMISHRVAPALDRIAEAGDGIADALSE